MGLQIGCHSGTRVTVELGKQQSRTLWYPHRRNPQCIGGSTGTSGLYQPASYSDHFRECDPQQHHKLSLIQALIRTIA